MITWEPTETERKTADYLVHNLPEIIRNHPGSGVFFELDEKGAIAQHTYDGAIAQDWQQRMGPFTIPQISDYVFLKDEMKRFMVGNHLLKEPPADWVLERLKTKEGE